MDIALLECYGELDADAEAPGILALPALHGRVGEDANEVLVLVLALVVVLVPVLIVVLVVVLVPVIVIVIV